MFANKVLVRANYDRARQRLRERRELLMLKRKAIEAGGGSALEGQLAASRDEIEDLEREIEEDERFLPAYEQRLEELRLEATYAIYARHPEKLDRIAGDHEATWEGIGGHLFDAGGGSRSLRDLLKRLSELEARHRTLHAEYREARESYERGGHPEDRYPPIAGPTRRLVATGCPARGSREQFEWLVSSSPASGFLRSARVRDHQPVG